MDELQWCHRDTVTVRHDGDTNWPPLRELREETRRLSREAARRDLSETEMGQRVPDELRRETERDMRHADVRAPRQDGGDIDGPQVVLVIERLRADFDEAGRG